MRNEVGISLKSEYYKQVLEEKPDIGWFEVHSENYFGSGGLPHYYLEQISQLYPISFHSIGMSLGSMEPMDKKYLKQLKDIVSKYNPFLISDHLSWSSLNGQYFNDLFPIEYTPKTLSNFCDKVSFVQDYLGREILIENPSSYIAFDSSTIPEWEFYMDIAYKTNCGLLLDVNNIYVSCHNHGYKFKDYINCIDGDYVKEIHLAGFSKKEFSQGDIIIDDHSCAICDDVWDLYKEFIQLIGKKHTLIERDSNIPKLDVLLDEANRAKNIMESIA